MRAHVHAVGLVRGRQPRGSPPSCSPTTPGTSARLQALLGRDPLPTAFPDGRDA